MIVLYWCTHQKSKTATPSAVITNLIFLNLILRVLGISFHRTHSFYLPLRNLAHPDVEHAGLAQHCNLGLTDVRKLRLVTDEPRKLEDSSAVEDDVGVEPRASASWEADEENGQNEKANRSYGSSDKLKAEIVNRDIDPSKRDLVTYRYRA